jgi:hypothetical protein
MGQNLAKGVLDLIKLNMYIPYLVQLADISYIFKNKASLLDLKIIILSVLRKILDKMVYCDKYDSNIGARKGVNIRNHLFIIYGVIHLVIQGEAGCIDNQIYDLVQAVDALWLDDCLSELQIRVGGGTLCPPVAIAARTVYG